MSSLLSSADGVSTCDGQNRSQHLFSSSVAALGTGTKAIACKKLIVYTKRLTLGEVSRSPHLGGYVAVRLGEARPPGPAEHERDRTLERLARRTDINDADIQTRQPNHAQLLRQEVHLRCAQCGTNPQAARNMEGKLSRRKAWLSSDNWIEGRVCRADTATKYLVIGNFF